MVQRRQEMNKPLEWRKHHDDHLLQVDLPHWQEIQIWAQSFDSQDLPREVHEYQLVDGYQFVDVYQLVDSLGEAHEDL